MIKYDIKASDRFSAALFPLVTTELSAIGDRLSQIPCRNRGEIVISFLKDHSLKTTWLSESKTTTDLITSRSFTTIHIESIFESCKKTNTEFLRSFEDYIQKQLDPVAA